METIIYTNTKREAANYQVDKICFADRIDIGQLIEDQMNHYNIRHLNFWFISSNVNHIEGSSEVKILASTGKYLSENKDMSFVFQHLVEKYLPMEIGVKKINAEGSSPKLMNKISNISTIREESFSTLSDKMRESEQSNKSGMVKTGFRKEEIFREQLKFSAFQDFEAYLSKELQANLQPDMIKTYIFRTNTEILKISFIQPNRRDFLKKIIDHDYDQVYDAKLLLKKKFTFQIDDYSCKQNQMLPTVATFHNKLILFLFQNQKINDLGTKKKTIFSKFKPNLSLQALQEWKIKEESVDIASKLERECDLIKQEIESERLMFRNKIRSVENYIGETINVERLVQQQDNDQTSKFQPSQTSFNSFKKPERGKKPSLLQGQGNQTFVNVTKFILNSVQNTSQFKRLKDISDAMRTIDITLMEQNKKIDSNKKRLKQLIKSKQSLLYSDACELNKIKNAILCDKSEIERKEMEIEEKKKKGVFEEMIKLKDRTPTPQAQINLEQHKTFMNTLKGNQGVQSAISLSQLRSSADKQKVSDHDYRITNKHLSQHNKRQEDQNFQKMSSLLKYREKRLKDVENSCGQLIKKKQQKQSLLKRTIRKPFSMGSTYQKDAFELDQQIPSESEVLNSQLLEQLVNLYNYYKNNEKLMDKVRKEVQSYKIIQIKPQNMGFKSSKGMSRSKEFTLAEFRSEKLDLEDYPILKEYMKSTPETTDQKKEKNKTKQYAKTFKEEIRYPQNYFDSMMGKKTVTTHQNNTNQKTHKTVTSLGSEEMDKMIESPYPSVKISVTPSVKTHLSATSFKHKRITIQQAIALNTSQLRLSKLK